MIIVVLKANPVSFLSFQHVTECTLHRRCTLTLFFHCLLSFSRVSTDRYSAVVQYTVWPLYAHTSSGSNRPFIYNRVFRENDITHGGGHVTWTFPNLMNFISLNRSWDNNLGTIKYGSRTVTESGSRDQNCECQYCIRSYSSRSLRGSRWETKRRSYKECSYQRSYESNWEDKQFDCRSNCRRQTSNSFDCTLTLLTSKGRDAGIFEIWGKKTIRWVVKIFCRRPTLNDYNLNFSRRRKGDGANNWR